MYALNIPSTKELLQHVAIDMQEPVMLWGQPGAGKSEGVMQLTEDNDALMCDVRLSQYDSVDLRGTPDIANSLTCWYPPATLPFRNNPNFPDDKLIVLFLDELTSATQSVAAVAYQLINDRRVGEHVLKDNVRIVAAGNRDGDRGVTNRMPTPLANRFTHAEVVVDAEPWIAWEQGKGVAPIFCAFLKFRPALISTFDPSKPDKAFATPRTWYKAAKYYASNMPEGCKQAAIAGAIGTGVAAEFMGYVDIWQNMPDLDTLIASPDTALVPENDVGMSYAIAVGLSGKMKASNAGKVHTYLKRMAPEYTMCAWSLAIKRDPDLTTTQAFMDMSAENLDLMMGV
jgi:hypothetical protein